MGTRSWSKGRLYRIKNHLDIACAIPYARVMECSFPCRRRFDSRFRSFWLRLVPALLLRVWAALLHLEGQARGVQACGGNSTVDSLDAKTAASARAFLAQLQAAVHSNKKEDIAGMISYP